VCFDKSGNFQEVRRAFELKGHKAGVHWFAFSADSHRSVLPSQHRLISFHIISEVIVDLLFFCLFSKVQCIIF